VYARFGSGKPSADPEAGCIKKQNPFGPSPHGTIGSGEKAQAPKMNRSSPYYGPNDRWLLESGDSVETKGTDSDLAPAIIREGKTVRTIAVQHEVKRSMK
jgi:hypothetical protein